MKIFNCIVFLFIITYQCMAQGGIRTSPTKFEFILDEGEVITKSISVTNTSNNKTTFNVKIEDYSIDSFGQAKFFKDTITSYSCAPWLKVIPEVFDLNPNQSMDISFQFSIPEGNHSTKWTSILIYTVKEKNAIEQVDKSLKLGMEFSVGSRLIVTRQSPQKINHNVELIDFNEIESPAIDIDSSRIFKMKAKNIGETIANCTFSISFANLETADELTIDPIEFKLYPEGVIVKEIQLPSNLSTGPYEVTGILDYNNPDRIDGKKLNIDIQ